MSRIAPKNLERLDIEPYASAFGVVLYVVTFYWAFQQHADSKIQSSTDKIVFHYHHSNVRQLLPASDYCRARGHQIVGHSSDNETVLSRSQNLRGAAKHFY